MADQTENAYQKQEAISIGGRSSKAYKASKKGKVCAAGPRSCYSQLAAAATPLRPPFLRPPVSCALFGWTPMLGCVRLWERWWWQRKRAPR